MSDRTAVLDVEQRPALPVWALLSLQHLFAMFGATVLVPLITGLNPAVALVSSGAGTLLYIVITKGRIPAYLGSSFAFIAPIIVATASADANAALIGCFFAGLVYVAISILIRVFGVGWLLRIIPPVVVGPVIMVIGLGLAGVAVDMATTGTGAPDGTYDGVKFGVALFTLAVTIGCAVYMKNFFSMVPVLVGVVVGYVVSIPLGLVDFGPVAAAAFFAVPDFSIPFVTYSPDLNGAIVLAFIAAAIVPVAEHIGDQIVLSKVVGRNFLRNPGLDRSILGDGLATMLAAILGGPPNTTYGENIGVLAVTRIFSIYVVGGAAVLAVVFGFIGKFAELIRTIPVPVMGGVSIMLFGIIAASGLRMMVDSKVDLSQKRNLVIASVILVIGVGGATIQVAENIQIAGMALAAIVGIVLNLALPGRPKEDESEAMFDSLD
ncbi:uracil permease [Rhodospirillaceae bacterium KN72]|uniref:Uracil permease n=1 Tax=Pacificispira spongiicola TaxID=2729598 RepID=A0A7Y0HDS1_9PROT|nr:solute carrier family 23 protein [Pacificispira spongiicola]NMM43955.1 uracil permease [Pacificispira spongiicola]